MRFFVTHDPTGEMRGGLLRGKGSDPTYHQVKKLIKKDIDINEMKRMDYIGLRWECRWRGEYKQTCKKNVSKLEAMCLFEGQCGVTEEKFSAGCKNGFSNQDCWHKMDDQ